MKKFYTIYKITNLINNNFYIGAHETYNIEDYYFGSGKYLNNAINKYGKENFRKEIMYLCLSRELMYDLESLLVDEKFIKRKDTYNIKLGGLGGYHIDHDSAVKNGHLGQKQLRLKLENDSIFCKHYYQKVSLGKKKYFENGGVAPFAGKKHTEETLVLMRKKQKGKQVGKKNSQFGTMWISNIELKQNKKIKKTDNIPDG